MRFLGVAATALLASAGLASAKCDAQNILDACLRSTEPAVEACSSNDWECLCNEYTDVLTCYNNCPDDEGKFGVQSQVTANCNAAKSYSSKSSSAAGSEATDAPTGTGSNKNKPSSGGDSSSDEESTATTTESAAAETSTGAAAAGMSVQAGGAVAAVLVGLGAWL